LGGARLELETARAKIAGMRVPEAGRVGVASNKGHVLRG